MSLHVENTGADASVTIATATLEQAIGTDVDVAQDAAEITAYLDGHLSVTGADGATWGEVWSGLEEKSVEGIPSVAVDVILDPGAADPATSAFTLTWNGVIDDVSGHQAVVVLTSPEGDVSTAGVLTAAEDSLTIAPDGTITSSDSTSTGPLDMTALRFHHVRDGADHLLFLVALLLPAPLVLAAGRWVQRGLQTHPASGAGSGHVAAADSQLRWALIHLMVGPCSRPNGCDERIAVDGSAWLHTVTNE